LVTGTAPQEGKSLVAANLAFEPGTQQRLLKTVLVDGDLRRPGRWPERFGLDRSLPGLSECLAGERPFARFGVQRLRIRPVVFAGRPASGETRLS